MIEIKKNDPFLIWGKKYFTSVSAIFYWKATWEEVCTDDLCKNIIFALTDTLMAIAQVTLIWGKKKTGFLVTQKVEMQSPGAI